ncbi:hypothetical protein QUF72_09050, partial [Desulfobacterales bacterium HSG2]|nr:hypothetical protein [Desulfobacterales bacterium HSG2]
VSFRAGGEDWMGDASRIVLETHSGNEGAGHCGSLLIEADDDISFGDGAMISSVTFGRGNTGDVTLRAGGPLSFSGRNSDFYHTGLNLRFFGQYRERNLGGVFSYISPKSSGGSGGDTLLEAGDITFSDGCSIHSVTLGSGSGGNITLRAAGPLSLTGSGGPDIWRGVISSAAYTLGEDSVAGDAGNILVEAGKLTLEDGRVINSTSVVVNGGKSGEAGDVTILVSGEVRLSGTNPFSAPQKTEGSHISSNSGYGDSEGGRIIIRAETLILEEGGYISASTRGTAEGGNVEIRVRDSVRISGYPVTICTEADECMLRPSGIAAASYRSSADTGSGGKISLSAKELILTDSGAITTSTWGGGDAGDINLEVGRLESDNALISSESMSETHGGAAGTITVDADSVRFSDDSAVRTEAVSAGGGKITVTAENPVCLSDSRITTSVRGGSGSGGDIAVSSPEGGEVRFVILNNSRIEANAHEGAGGNIRIVAGHFVQSSESVVEASSEKGIDGSVNIESPGTDIGGDLVILPETLIDAARWMKKPCSARTGEKSSSFVIKGRDAVPTALDDLRASPPMWLENRDKDDKLRRKP